MNRIENMEIINGMAKDMLAKASEKGDDRIAPMIDRLFRVLAAKPDSYFNGRMAGDIWRDAAKEAARM